MRLRAPRPDEAQAVLDVILAADIATIGRPDYTLQDVLYDWSLPGFEREADAFVVEDEDGALIGWADVDEVGARVTVHPAHQGRGVGTLLREAIERRMRERGFVLQQGIVTVNAAAVAHLRAAGWERIQTYQRLRADLRGTTVPAPPPVAQHVRRFHLTAEGPAIHELIEAAFSEIAFNAPQSYASWSAEVEGKSAPEYRLALDDEHGLVAIAIGQRWEDGVGYVSRLAVAARARGRGHGRVVLLALLGAFRAAGLTTAELSVAGTNATATGLYESVGMTPDYASERWRLPAPPTTQPARRTSASPAS